MRGRVYPIRFLLLVGIPEGVPEIIPFFGCGMLRTVIVPDFKILLTLTVIIVT